MVMEIREAFLRSKDVVIWLSSHRLFILSDGKKSFAPFIYTKPLSPTSIPNS